MSVAIIVGYVNGSGVNDEMVVSPSNRPTGTALRDLIVSSIAFNGTPVWVDGVPAQLVAGVASHLGVPVGKPDGWDPTPPSIPVDTSGFPPAPAPSMMDAAI
jgi:hypothetical protein